jgi:hypothetical protein
MVCRLDRIVHKLQRDECKVERGRRIVIEIDNQLKTYVETDYEDWDYKLC